MKTFDELYKEISRGSFYDAMIYMRDSRNFDEAELDRVGKAIGSTIHDLNTENRYAITALIHLILSNITESMLASMAKKNMEN